MGGVAGEAGGFQSTLPARGATNGRLRSIIQTAISIHAPRKGSDDISKLTDEQILISIHAPRKGSDACSTS